MLRPFLLAAFACVLWTPAADAQIRPSICQAIAKAVPHATFAAWRADGPFRLAAAEAGDVTITFIQHSTYRIESPEGVTIATDYAGFGGRPVPNIVTMNKAHSSHYTNSPEPGIVHVLRGWNPAGGAAHHDIEMGDVLVRNVSSDLRVWGGGIERDANSIFIFETAGLCIGHLGHLHERLSDAQYAGIGRLDVVMVPVDDSVTLSQDEMAAMVNRLQSRVVLPMHNLSGRMDRFLARLPGFDVQRVRSRSVTISLRTLPSRPTVMIVDGV